MNLPVIDNPRKCGNCSACCTTLEVNEAVEHRDAETDELEKREVIFHKPAYVKCEHVRNGNHSCGIYDKRPGPCAVWSCGWLGGLGSNKDRPDKSGVVFSSEVTDLGPTIIMYDYLKGASRSGRMLQLAQLVLDKQKKEQQIDMAVIGAGQGFRHILVCPPALQHVVIRQLVKGVDGQGNVFTAQTTAGGKGPDW